MARRILPFTDIQVRSSGGGRDSIRLEYSPKNIFHRLFFYFYGAIV